MSLQCPTSRCYVLLQVLPGQIVFVLMTLPVWLSVFLSFECINRTKAAKLYQEMVLTFAENVFGNILKIHYSEEQKGKFYTVINYEVSSKHMYWLFIFFIQGIGMAFVQFWEVFLIEESHICRTDRYLACFDSNTRLDCSNITTYGEQITSVTCYKFVFRFANAIVSAIGIMAAAGMLVYLIISFLLKVSNGSKCPNFRKRLTVVIQYTGAVMAMLICAVLCILLYFSTPRGPDFANTLSKTIGMCNIIMGTFASFPHGEFKNKNEKLECAYEKMTE